jgi:hypothetical protein
LLLLHYRNNARLTTSSVSLEQMSSITWSAEESICVRFFRVCANPAISQYSAIVLQWNNKCQSSSSWSSHTAQFSGPYTRRSCSLRLVGRHRLQILQARFLVFGGTRVCHRLLQSPVTWFLPSTANLIPKLYPDLTV